MAVINPDISIVMPAYNAGRFIREAIDSILLQTYRNFEFIIINDGSIDDTSEIVRSYDDPRIRFIDNVNNLGLIAVRNLGMSLASGKYVALLDADDISYPSRLEKQFTFLEHNPEFSMIGSNMEMIDERGHLIKKIRYTIPPDKIPSQLFFGNYFAQSAVMIRRESLPSEIYRNFPGVEDYDLWIRMSKSKKVWNLQETLLKYRVHEAGISFRKEAEIESYLRTIIRQNIETLRCCPTAEELDIHRSMDRCGGERSLDFINNGERWLLKLDKLNNYSKKFDTVIFRNVLGEKWFYICLSARKAGLQTWRTFSHSPLRRFVRIKLYQSVGLFVICLLNQFRKSTRPTSVFYA